MCRYLKILPLLLAGLGAVFPVAPGTSAEPAVTGVRVGNHVSMTRFVLEATERLEAEVFTLASPYRVVIDLPEVSWRLPEGVGKTGAGLIENFRYGLFAPGKSRVVLDVKAPVAVKKSFILAPNGGYRYRLVLDLERVSRKAFFERVEAGRRSRKVAALPVPSPLPSMIAVIEILFSQYNEKSKLYLTWDAVSWHSSNALLEWLDRFNDGTRAAAT